MRSGIFKFLAGFLFLAFCVAILIELFVAKEKSISFLISGSAVAGFFLFYLFSKKKGVSQKKKKGSKKGSANEF
jgi:hypothetical protein